MPPAAKGKATFLWWYAGEWYVAVYQIARGRDPRLVACFNGVAAALSAVMLEGNSARRAIVIGPSGPFERLEAIVLHAGQNWLQLLLVVPKSLIELERHVRVEQQVVGRTRLTVFRTSLLNDYSIFVADLELETLLRIIPEPTRGCKDALIGRGLCAFRTAEAGLRRHGPLSGLVILALLTHLADHELLPVDIIHFWDDSKARLPRIIDLNGESTAIVLPTRGVSHGKWT